MAIASRKAYTTAMVTREVADWMKGAVVGRHTYIDGEYKAHIWSKSPMDHAIIFETDHTFIDWIAYTGTRYQALTRARSRLDEFIANVA